MSVKLFFFILVYITRSNENREMKRDFIMSLPSKSTEVFSEGTYFLIQNLNLLFYFLLIEEFSFELLYFRNYQSRKKNILNESMASLNLNIDVNLITKSFAFIDLEYKKTYNDMPVLDTNRMQQLKEDWGKLIKYFFK